MPRRRHNGTLRLLSGGLVRAIGNGPIQAVCTELRVPFPKQYLATKLCIQLTYLWQSANPGTIRRQSPSRRR